MKLNFFKKKTAFFKVKKNISPSVFYQNTFFEYKSILFFVWVFLNFNKKISTTFSICDSIEGGIYEY